MIELHKTNAEVFDLNPGRIIQVVPESDRSVIVLVNGETVEVVESRQEIRDAVKEWHREIRRPEITCGIPKEEQPDAPLSRPEYVNRGRKGK